MSALTEFLFPAPAKRTVGGIVRWWESRRLAYNVFVGTAGLFTTATFAVLTSLPPISDPELIPWEGILLFGIGANVFYTLGSIVEIAVQKLWRGEVLPVGPVLYRMGLTFGVGLALFPAVIFTSIWVIRVVLMVTGLG